MNDDTLILFYGDELDAAERREVEKALANDPELAQRYQSIKCDMDAMLAMPAPSVDVATRTRWHRVLDQHDAGTNDQRHAGWMPPLWAMATAMGVLAIGIVIGLQVGTESSSVTVQQVAKTQPSNVGTSLTDTVFSRGLASYMQTSKVRLVELETTDNAARQAILGEIVAHNRAFERAAKEHGADDIARVLRAFEQSLLQLTDIDSEDKMRRNADQLAFEYGAMLTRLAPRASKLYTL